MNKESVELQLLSQVYELGRGGCSGAAPGVWQSELFLANFSGIQR